MAELYLITPNNTSCVWGLKSEPRCERVPTGNQMAARDQREQRAHEDLSKDENVGENKSREVEKYFLVFC